LITCRVADSRTADDLDVIVQPGVPYEDLNQELAKYDSTMRAALTFMADRTCSSRSILDLALVLAVREPLSARR